MTTTKPRGREETEQRLVRAVEDVLREQGFAALGVNAVAQRAGVDKVLIYRYFDGLPGLIRRYAEGGSFWPTVDELLGPDRAALATLDPAVLGARLLTAYARALRSRPIALELLAWECNQRNELTAVLEEVRERTALKLFAALPAASGMADPRVAAGVAVLSAGINYLAIRGPHVQRFGGADVSSEEGWAQIEGTFEAMLRGLLGGTR